MFTEALELAKLQCATMMNKFAAADLPPAHSWHYHQGVFLLGMYKIYEITGDEIYFNYIKDYVDSVMFKSDYSDGEIKYSCKPDDAMPCILTFPLYERTKEEKYTYILKQCMEWLPNYFKTPSGGFWHAYTRPHQMWLDGFYMTEPLCTKYAATFDGHDEFYKMAYDQLVLMKKFTKDERTGLWYHAYDESRSAFWADKQTGRSPEFWGRAFGWIGAALADIIDYMPESIEYRDFFIENLREYADTIMSFRDKKTGIWYQVLDKADCEGNWCETSCSCLFAYAVAKGIRMGYVDKKYLPDLREAFEGIKKQLTISEKEVLINNICIGTGVGNYEHYINRPRTVNDLHGSGAFLHAMAELAKVL